ncbi:hypothetical protein BRADI_4g30771v3 [Brachypodium distachyon]|uniref:DUF4283 domain-containing protein n=1 Tax=Brachypodium distachyon TaxID=15368 RepID=A0A2K2CRI2_BRADI|nr:hypothetical protein BRADI_4g30771v3 [Brachypodium distachyon]
MVVPAPAALVVVAPRPSLPPAAPLPLGPAVNLPGEPGARPRGEYRIIPRSRAVDAAEEALAWSLVVTVAGARGRVPSSAIDALISRACPLASGLFSVHHFWPEDFLRVCSSEAVRSAILAVGVVQGGGFSPRFNKWNRQLQPTLRPLRYMVYLELDGIPPHAWNVETAKFILGPACWVKRLGTETANRDDMGRFSVIAWTVNPEGIVSELEIGIPEPLPPLDADDHEIFLKQSDLIPVVVSVLDYPVIVHLLRVEDREEFTDISSPNFSAGSSDDGSDPGGDLGRGSSPRRPRSRVFPFARGVVDGQRPASGGADGAVDLSSDVGLVESMVGPFRCDCRRVPLAVLPSPSPRPVVLRQSKLRRSPPRPIRRSARVANRRRSCSSVGRQQKLLISRLGLALEGEQIGDEALAAYIKLFEQPLSGDHIAAILAIFVWEPDALPLMSYDMLAVVVS